VLIHANFSDLQETAKKRQVIAEEHLDTAQKRFKNEDAERKREREEKCLHLFRLTESSKDVTYEWYKDRVEERVEGTCMWFLHHAHFLEWIKQDSGLLLVSADPGCGKSVLAKYLVDHVLPGSATVCYYFFKDQDQNTVRQALCALLHQLMSQKPALIQHAIKMYQRDGQSLIHSTSSLWTVLQDAVQDKQAGSVIILLDALDECFETEIEDLVRNIESQSRNCQSSHGRLKFIMTSRPYEQIVAKFRGLFDSFPRIHIPGEEESEAISQEVNHVIRYRVERLGTQMRLTDVVKKGLADRLIKIEHRTYLWVYLVFDNINTGFKRTKKGIEEATKSLPRTVNEAYERILAKSTDPVTVRRALAMILAASRPLTLSELNLALEIKETTQSIQDDELENEGDFKSRLRSLCGLFVSVHHGKVYFLHQTAREFLLADPLWSTPTPQGMQWQYSITMQNAHKVLAKCCVWYLSFLNSDANLFADVTDEESSCTPHAALFDYSARYWPMHFRESRLGSNGNAAISHLSLKVSDPSSRSFSRWSRLYWYYEMSEDPGKLSQLVIASLFGHDTVVQILVDEDADINAQGGWYGNPLQVASTKGHTQVVKILLDKGANVNMPSGQHATVLQVASAGGFEDVVQLLLNKGANVHAQHHWYGSALQVASVKGHEQIVKILLDKGARVNEWSGRLYGHALQAASEGGYEQIVKMLLDKGADVNMQGKESSNALQEASARGYEQIVKMLLKEGANVNAQGGYYGNALQAALGKGHEHIVKMLLDKGANVNAEGGYFGTALQAALERGHEQIVKMLLDKGAKANACIQGGHYGNALQAASSKGYEQIVKMLLDKGANVNAQGGFFSNALQGASARGYEQIVKMLLDKGADVNACVQGGRYSNALQAASAEGHKQVVETLLERGADVNACVQGEWYRNALEAASKRRHQHIVELLLKHGARRG
jgi:ankyrin repeat protein